MAFYIIYQKKGFNIPAPSNYEDLNEVLNEYKGKALPNAFTMRYMDTEKDLIMLGSEEDFKAMCYSESEQKTINIYIDDGTMDPDDTDFDIIEVEKPKKVIEHKVEPKDDYLDESVAPKLNPFMAVSDEQKHENGCYVAQEVYLDPKDLKVNVPGKNDPVFVAEYEKEQKQAQEKQQVQKAHFAPVVQQVEPSLKLEDIRSTMIDVLKNNFPDILNISLKGVLPAPQPEMQPNGIDKKLRGIIRTLLTSYRDQSHFDRAKIDESLGGSVEKLLNYFEDDEDIVPPLPAVVKKKDSENADIYSNPNKNKKENNIAPLKKIPEVEEKKIEEKKVPEPKPVIHEKPFDLHNVNAESVIFKPSNPDEKKNNNYIADFSCCFVKDVSTLPKNLTVNDATILKTISLRNDGAKRWPEGATLEYVDGLKFKAVKMASLEPGKEFSTVIQIESPKKPGDFSCIAKFACPVFGVFTYPNDPFELSVHIDEDKKQPSEYKPPVVDNEIPKDWAAKIKVVKEIIPDADDKKIIKILKANNKASTDDIVNELFN